MDTKTTSKSRISQLSKRLEKDIQSRALRAGDRYLTAAEAAVMLGVSTSTADRAMKLLADSELLLRRQNQGTFVGPRAAVSRLSTVRTIHVILPGEFGATPVRSDLIMKGIRDEFQSVNVQFSFLTREETILHVRELIDSAKSNDRVAGIVPMSGPREAYRLLAASSVPCVVVGSPYLGDPPIASIDVDNHGAGRLLTEYLVKRGHRRIAVLTVSEGRPGDHDFFDGVAEALTAAKLPPAAMLVRSVPDDIKSCSAITRHTLELADRPTAFIARHEYVAERVVSAAVELGFKIPDDIEVVFEDFLATQAERPRHVCTRPKTPLEDTAALIGRMLKALSRGEPLEQQRVVVPVGLHVPISGTQAES